MANSTSPRPLATFARTSPAAAADVARVDWLGEFNSYLASAVCHLVALVVLGLLAATVNHPAEGISLDVQLGDGNDVLAGEEGARPGDEGLDEVTAQSELAVEPQQLIEFQAVATPEPELADISLEPIVAMSAAVSIKDVADQIDRSLKAKGGRGGGLGESGDGPDAWSGRGSPGGREKGFFGIGDAGKSFVYVVDCSDSMNERGKFTRARYELIHALEELSQDQRFFVIFYNDGAYPMGADDPVKATEEEIAETTSWINSVEPIGGTNPLPALVFALALRPDAIYFLSDGQFDPRTLVELRARNRDDRRLELRRIPIHTIAFGDRAAESLMKSISRSSGGQHRFVK